MILFLGQLILFRLFFFFLCYQCLTVYNKNYVFWLKGCARFFLYSSETFFFLSSLYYPFFFTFSFFKKNFGASLPLRGFRQLPDSPSGRASPGHSLFNHSKPVIWRHHTFRATNYMVDKFKRIL